MPTQVHASRVWALWEKAGFVLGVKMWLLPAVGARNEGADAGRQNWPEQLGRS